MRARVAPHRVVKVYLADDPDEHRIDVGRLVPLETPTPGHTHRRVIEADDAARAARQVLALLVARGVGAVLIEQNTGVGAYADDARLIGAAIETACRSAGIEIETAETATKPKGERLPEPQHVPEDFPPAALDVSRELAAELASAPPPPLAAPRGPRVAGIDPGSHWIAVTVGEGTAAPMGYVASRVFDVGRLVPLAKPKVTKRADGTVRTTTHRRIIEDADIDGLLADVVRYLRGLEVAHVVVERATHFYGGNADRAKAAQLARAQWIGGELAGALRVAGASDMLAGAKVESVSSASWRAVAKKRGATWRAGVLASFTAWPSSLPGEHAIDAAGLCLFGVAKPFAGATRPKGPKAPRVRKRSSADSHAARDAKRAAARAAAGCNCKGRRGHAMGCPARKAS